MQRFQVSYNLKAIPEVQDFLNASFDNSKRSGDFQDLYRRRWLSLVFFCMRVLKRYDGFFFRLVCLWNLSNLRIQFRWVICDNCSIGRHGHNLRRRRRRRRWFSESDRLTVSLSSANWWWYFHDGSFFFPAWDGFSCGHLFFLFFQGWLVFFFFLFIYSLLCFPPFEKDKNLNHLLDIDIYSTFDFVFLVSFLLCTIPYLCLRCTCFPPFPFVLGGLGLCCFFWLFGFSFSRSSRFLFDLDLFFRALPFFCLLLRVLFYHL